jgi:hypothetical protein
MSFAHGDATSVFSAMRPRQGQALTRAVVTTYSLDLVALLGLVLALGGDDEADFASSPLGLVKAFDRVRGKLLVMHQLGRISVPRAHRAVLPLLDTMVLAVPTDERSASWHPKVMLARYDGDSGVEWRFWLGSRNLTGSTDIEAGLLLVSGRGTGARTVVGIPALAADLLREAKLGEDEMAELRAARWHAPPGVSVRKVVWRRPGETRRFLDDWSFRRPERIRAVSPFIDRGALQSVIKTIGGPMTLLTTREAKSRCSPIDRLTFKLAAAPDPEVEVDVLEQQEEASGDFSERPAIGVHAKLLMASRGAKTELMVGSANLTGRGLEGPNAEAVALVVVEQAVANALERFIDDGLELADELPDPERESRLVIERKLDHAVFALLGNKLTLAFDVDGLRLSIDGGMDELLDVATLFVSAFGSSGRPVVWARGLVSIVLLDRMPPMEERSSLVVFRARSLEDPTVERTWVQRVELQGLDEEKRDLTLLARYVGADRFRAWLRALLDGYDPTAGRRWNEGRDGVDGGGSRFGMDGMFTLETMLASWARDPVRFETSLDGIVAMLDTFEETFRDIEDAGDRAEALRELGEVRPFIEAVMAAVAGPVA